MVYNETINIAQAVTLINHVAATYGVVIGLATTSGCNEPVKPKETQKNSN